MTDNELYSAVTRARRLVSNTPPVPTLDGTLCTQLASALVEMHERYVRSVRISRLHVQSSNVVSIGYHADARVLAIEFPGERVYRYADVPREVYDALMQAESKGAYFARHIRDTFVTFKPVEGAKS